MPINRSKKRVAVAKSVIEREGGIVILPVKEYHRLLENTVPGVYLKGKTARALDRLVTEGLQEYFAGKTRKIESLADLDR